MSVSPAMAIVEILRAASIGVISGAASTWLLKVGRTLEEHHQQIAVTDTFGFKPDSKFLLDWPTVQIRVRGNPDDYDGAYVKMLEVKNFLTGHAPTTITPIGGGSSEGTIDSITMLGDIGFVYYDDSSRPVWSGNFRLIQERTSDAGAGTQRQALP